MTKTFLLLLLILTNSSYLLARDIFELSLEELLSVQVSVASLKDEPFFDAPSKVKTFSSESLQRLGIRRLEGLVNFVAGAQYYRDGLESVVIFRGRKSQDNNDILVLLDGMRLNDPVSGNAFAMFKSLSLDNIERVEVINGPGSAIYGDNAFNGVISLTSKKEGQSVSVEAGSFGHKRGAIRFQGGDEFSYSFHAEKYREDGDDYDPFFEFFGESLPASDPSEGETASLHLAYKGFGLKLGRHYSKEKAFPWAGHYKDINEYEIRSDYLNFNYDQDYEDLTLKLNLQIIESEQSALIVQMPPAFASVNWWSNGADEPFVGGNYRQIESRNLSVSGYYRDNLILGVEYRESFADEINFQGNWNQSVNVESRGLEWIPNNGGVSRGEFYFLGNRQPLVPKSSRYVNSAYAQYQHNLSEDWLLTAGVRYDDYSDVSSNVSFRGGIVHHMGDDISLKLLYGEAFRAPTLFETRALIATGAIGNPDLKPETIKTVDLVWQQRWGALETSVTYYWSRIENTIALTSVEDIVSGFNSFQPENTNEKILSGFEIESAYNFNDSLSLRSDFSRANKNMSLGVSKTTFSMALNYSWDRWDATISGWYHSQVEGFVTDEVLAKTSRIPSFFLLNATLYRALNDQITLSLSANNLLDKSYSTFSATAGLEKGSPARGRELYFSLEYSL